MGMIRILDNNTIDKIAAGEVVERPSSVVKELIENALDAGATEIIVTVSEGGRRRISVKDNGIGMSPEDAEMAFARHATSKIGTIDDLRSLDTYGFRGEALSSIAAVARVTVRTREHGRTEGAEIIVEGGDLVSSTPVGCPEGTEIVVEDIFGNLPARKKQMKYAAVELAHCREVVTDFMLSRPAVSFRLLSDDKPEFVHAAVEGMNGALALAFGRVVASDMLEGHAEIRGIHIDVNLARLEHTRSSPSDLRLFVNHRPVKSRRLLSTVAGVFGSRMMKGRYPVGVVKIQIDSSAVDVNVHPTKREVRFDDDKLVNNIVEKSMMNALEGSDLSFRYDLTGFSEGFETRPPSAESAPSSSMQSILEKPEGDSITSMVEDQINPLAQIMDTYILAESHGSLVLIDQHAASERITYERLLTAIESSTEVSQELLAPLVLSLSPKEARMVEEHRERLLESGFDLEPFGGESYALRAVPTVLGAAQGEKALRDILSDMADMAVSKRMGLEFIWRVACHSSIRAGQRLSRQQMSQLVSELMATENPFTCEHGRPTMITLTSEDLEKLFKRRG
ncbi:MAG: DNA mismatch repair endonuclease MutL [Methanobacteriota archaeon]|nr:MAG: DNA mismatch repair endonuclease MutL [Euryarchaeota archaeon]